MYSGVLREGDKMYVISGAYDPSEPEDGACEEVVIEELYLMMGQGMFRVKEVPAGNVLAIGGLEKYVSEECYAVEHQDVPTLRQHDVPGRANREGGG